MNCPLCADWGSNPNCSHYLSNGVRMPRGCGHRIVEVVGRRAWENMRAENGLSERGRLGERGRLEHIERQCFYAEQGGW